MNARTAAVRTERGSFHFERTRSSEMNVKSIAGQPWGKTKLALHYRLILLIR